MFSKDGKPVIADPLDAYSGKYADEDGVKKTLNTLKQNIEMIEDILNKKTNHREFQKTWPHLLIQSDL